MQIFQKQSYHSLKIGHVQGKGFQIKWLFFVRMFTIPGDEVYGNDGKFWWWLEQQYQQAYLLTVASSHCVFIGYQEHRVKTLAQALPNEQWQRFSCGNGTKGERIYDWARIAVNCSNEHGMKRWILLRRNIEKPDDPLSITYYQVYAPAHTTLEETVLVAGQRWRIEECFAIAKDKLGLSQYEVRSWTGWHRHMTLVMAAQAFLTVLRHQVEPIPVPPKSLLDNGKTHSSMAAFKVARELLSH